MSSWTIGLLGHPYAQEDNAQRVMSGRVTSSAAASSTAISFAMYLKALASRCTRAGIVGERGLGKRILDALRERLREKVRTLRFQCTPYYADKLQLLERRVKRERMA
jgi:hypothetical protein